MLHFDAGGHTLHWHLSLEEAIVLPIPCHLSVCMVYVPKLVFTLAAAAPHVLWQTPAYLI
jgi:hypothetical protein